LLLFAVVLGFGDDGTLEATFTVGYVVVDCFPLLDDDDEPFTALDESSLLVALRLDGGELEIGVDGEDDDCCSLDAANRRLDDDESFLDDELLLQIKELINGCRETLFNLMY
jgi:hypothetical protein